MDRATRTEFWRYHVAQYLQGEHPLRAYCREHGLNRSSFGYWRRRFASEPGALDSRPVHPPVESTTAIELVRVELAPSVMIGNEAESNALELVLHDGRHIRVPVGFDAPTLRRLLETVEGAR